MILIEEIQAEVAADPESVGLILHGSRAAGAERPESDYDVIRVLTEEGYAAREARDDFRKLHEAEGSLPVDVAYVSLERLRRIADAPDWRVGMLVTGRVLVDRDGELAALVAEIVRRAGEHAFDRLPEYYDDYLNCFVRSLKAWRRGDELGGRMQASESCLHLVRLLFALERRWPPYHDQLGEPLAELELVQGWEEGYLTVALTRVLASGDPSFQQELELRVEALLDSRGIAHEWGPEDDLEALKQHRFG